MPIQAAVVTARPAVFAESEAAKRLLPGACVVSTSGNVFPKYRETTLKVEGVGSTLALNETVGEEETEGGREPAHERSGDADAKGVALVLGMLLPLAVAPSTLVIFSTPCTKNGA